MEIWKRIMASNRPTRSISHISVPTVRTVAEDLSSGDSPVITLDQLYSINDVGSFWICATILSFIGDWWYLSCSRCPKKLTKAGDKFYYERCDTFYQSGHFRYKIQMQVIDDTGNAAFLCWDRDCEHLIGKSCANLRNEYMENEGGDGQDIPDELAILIDKQVFFKVQVRADQLHNYDGSFSVVKLTTDSDLIKRFYSAFESQESNFLSKLQTEELDEQKEVSSENEVNTPNKTVKKRGAVTGSPSLKRELVFKDLSSCTNSKKMKYIVKEEDLLKK